jgi:hypothetical protein
MNKAMIVAADWAFIAGLLSTGSANVFLTQRRRLYLTLHANSGPGAALSDWLTEQGRTFAVDRGRNTHRIRFRFEGNEAIKVLTKTESRITCPALLRKVHLAFDYWRTMQKRGVKLPSDVKAERERIVRKFKKLKTA